MIPDNNFKSSKKSQKPKYFSEIVEKYPRLGHPFKFAYNSFHTKDDLEYRLHQIEDLPPSVLTILRCLLNAQHTEEGQLNISNLELATRTHLSEATVKRAISYLKNRFPESFRIEYYYPYQDYVKRRQIMIDWDLMLFTDEWSKSSIISALGHDDLVTTKMNMFSYLILDKKKEKEDFLNRKMDEFSNNINNPIDIKKEPKVSSEGCAFGATSADLSASHLEEIMPKEKVVGVAKDVIETPAGVIDENSARKRDDSIPPPIESKSKVTSGDTLTTLKFNAKKMLINAGIVTTCDYGKRPDEYIIPTAKEFLELIEEPEEIKFPKLTESREPKVDKGGFCGTGYATMEELKAALDAGLKKPIQKTRSEIEREKLHYVDPELAAYRKRMALASEKFFQESANTRTKKIARSERIQRLREIYPNYLEVLRREKCDLEEIQYRMRNNEQYEPFDGDISNWNNDCHPRYGFMTEEERDKEFIKAVDTWLHPAPIWGHSKKSLTMFSKGRIRADRLKVTYYDWVAAIYDGIGELRIQYTHINCSFAEELVQKWQDRGGIYPNNFGYIQRQNWLRQQELKGGGKRRRFYRKRETAEQIIAESQNIIKQYLAREQDNE